MSKPVKKWATFALRWGVAVAGIWWVVSNMHLRDRVWVLAEQNGLQQVKLAASAREDSREFAIVDPVSGETRVVGRDRVVNYPDRPGEAIKIRTAAGEQVVYLSALRLRDDLRATQALLVADAPGGAGRWIRPQEVVGGYQLRVPHPRIEVGLGSMIRRAKPWLLVAALLIFPITFVITSVRWNVMLRALGIRLTQMRTFVLNMVGFFYSTFMPGSTGGDLLKAYYASKQTPHRTQAVLSVFIDRVIGLLALIVLGGAMSAYQYVILSSGEDPAAMACRRVALGSAAILGLTLVATGFFAHSRLRRAMGVDFIISRLPLQKHVQHAIQVGRTYRERPGVVIWAILVTLPVHITVVISAIFAGKAFGLPLPTVYYFVAVPVIVLSGALPLSPQGAGVMEFFAIQLTKQHGVTVSQAFALTMSIRLVQILWNLTGGIFVLRGGYHAPTEQEQQEMERDEAETIGAVTSEAPHGRIDGQSVQEALPLGGPSHAASH